MNRPTSILRSSLLALLLAPLVAPATARAAGLWVDEDLGGAPASAPCAASDGERRWVFFEGRTGTLWMIRREAWGRFEPAVDLGVAVRGTPSAVVLGVDRVRVFFRGGNDHLTYVEGDGRTFGPAVDLGGLTLSSAPSAAVGGLGVQAVLYRGPGGRLFESRWSGGAWWSAPRDLGQAITAAPAALVPYSDPDHVVVLHAAPDRTLRRSAFDGSTWTHGPALTDVSLAEPASVIGPARGRTVAFYRLPSGEVVRRVERAGAWEAAEPTGVLATASPAACGSDEVFVIGRDGRIHRAVLEAAPASPRYSAVSGTATHNSYWINRNRHLDPFAGGTEELLLDQLLHERARSIEIDVHTDKHHPGVWTIYHTNRPQNAQVHTLAELVEVLRSFQRAVPRHEVVNVLIELKNTALKLWPPLATRNNFQSTHTIEQFDRTFTDALGADALYTPRDLLARAAPGSTLGRAVEVAGWPTVDELRGKFIINIQGGWGNAYYDWHRYAAEGGGVAERVAFPLRSILDDQGGGVVGWPGNSHDRVPQAWLQVARDASVFWQVERLSCPLVPDFLRRNGIVRGHDAFELREQEDRLRRGYHFVLTDFPWHVLDEQAPGVAAPDPSRRLRDPGRFTGRPPIDPDALVEPGERLSCSTDDRRHVLYRRATAASGGTRLLETTVSTTRVGDPHGRSFPRVAREGGLGGLVAILGAGESVAVLRVKTGHSGDGLEQERLAIRVEVTRGGVTRSRDLVTNPYSLDRVGSLLGLWIDDRGPGSAVRVLSAGKLDAADDPEWTLLADERFAGRVVAEGLVFTRDVLFVGTRESMNGAAARPITLRDLPWLDAPARVLDLSWPRVASAPPVVSPLP